MAHLDTQISSASHSKMPHQSIHLKLTIWSHLHTLPTLVCCKRSNKTDNFQSIHFVWRFVSYLYLVSDSPTLRKRWWTFNPFNGFNFWRWLLFEKSRGSSTLILGETPVSNAQYDSSRRCYKTCHDFRRFVFFQLVFNFTINSSQSRTFWRFSCESITCCKALIKKLKILSSETC